LLLDHGLNADTQDINGLTPLHLVSSRREPPYDIDTVWKAKLKVVRLLLDRGANAGVQDKEGRTPLDVVSGEEKDEIEQLLTEHGA